MPGTVLPCSSVWSMPMAVMIAISGAGKWAGSILPADSMTAAFTFSRLKYSIAIPVSLADGGGVRPSASARPFTRLAQSVRSLPVMGLPLMAIRSLQVVIWGDVKSPVLYPACVRMAAANAHVEPFPFVPATRTTLNGIRPSGELHSMRISSVVSPAAPLSASI